VADLHQDGFDVPRRALKNALDRVASADWYFFSGMRGAGKTTELRRLKADLEETGRWVVLYTNLSEYLPLNALVEIGDFLLVVVSALADEVERRFGEDFKQIGPLARFVKFLQSEVKLEGLEWSVDTLLGRVGVKAKKVFDSVENLFNAHRDKLRFTTLDVVYSVPPHISAMAAAGAGRVFTLSMVKVFERPGPGAHGRPSPAGIDKMMSVIDRRSREWRSLIAEPDMRELARMSGGDIRELFSLVRETLNLLDPDDDAHFPAPTAAIEQCIKLRRNQFGTIPADHMKWLTRVVQTHGHGLLTAQDLGTLAQLLDGKLMLQYRNGENWYDVHPILWDVVHLDVPSA